MHSNNQGKLILYLVLGLFMICCHQVPEKQEVVTLESIASNFDQYREPVISERRFKHKDLVPVIEDLPDDIFSISVLGRSIEGREIYLIKLGSGPEKVLLWSQMHGNEPTATMAIMDLFRYFQSNEFSSAFVQNILGKLTLYFIPMLNPDGAENYVRRNAIDVDLNRDALRLSCPESQILKLARDSIQADWGFNLHDQNRYHSAGANAKTASISFLAPAYNDEKDWNLVRTRAMQVIVRLNETIQTYLPGHVGRYDDTFEPRAFGDNMQKWGSSTILIETGGLKNDREKQELRKLNFIMLLRAFHSIANKDYADAGLEDYLSIPMNRSRHHDLIVREVQIFNNDNKYLLDLAFRQSEHSETNGKTFHLRGFISDIGDLHNFHGYSELAPNGFVVEFAKVFPKVLPDLKALEKIDHIQHLRDGFGYCVVEDFKDTYRDKNFLIPIKPGQAPDHSIALGRNPSFFLVKNDVAHFAVVNGNLISLLN